MTDESPAPITRLQRIALIQLPVFLLLGAATGWRALADGGDPLAAKLLMLVGVGVMIGGLVWAQSSGECPDEREQAIRMKAFRNAYLPLFLGVVFLTVIDGPARSAEDISQSAAAMGFFSMALWAGSVLFYARKGG